MLHGLSLPNLYSTATATATACSSGWPHHHNHLSRSQPPLYLKFYTTYRENLRYLKTIGVIDANTHPNKLPMPDAAAQILGTVNFFKSKGFVDADFARLASYCPQLFSVDHFDPTDVEPIFQFLISDLHATPQESKALVTYCPRLLFSDVEYCLRPTLSYLRQLGVARLNVPNSLNAHLLNTPEEKLRSKVKFLKSIGFSHEEAARFCARLPAIFGYGIETNLRPKLQYFLEDMERSLEELREFPQYFGFCLERRIAPRHLIWRL